MKRIHIQRTLLFLFLIVAVLMVSLPAAAQNAATAYPKMAPIEQYLMDRNAEIALARDAEVLVLGPHGFETAVKGKNGFVCIVGRGWSSAADPDFWNPKVRVPMCVNALAARSYLLAIKKITELGLAGRTLDQVNKALADAIAKKELPAMESGSMCYMTGKEGYGGDVAPHWPPHVMFFYSDTDVAIWDANLAGSPIMGLADPLFHLTQFVIPVEKYSDGTPAATTAEHKH